MVSIKRRTQFERGEDMDRLFAARPHGERFTLRRIFGDTPSTLRGLAAPVSLLLIVFSLTMISTVAYNYALRQIDNRKEDLKLVAAEEKMLDLEEAITSTAWTPSGSRTLAFSDYGGQLRWGRRVVPYITATLGASSMSSPARQSAGRAVGSGGIGGLSSTRVQRTRLR
jgi:hypothetical protein